MMNIEKLPATEGVNGYCFGDRTANEDHPRTIAQDMSAQRQRLRAELRKERRLARLTQEQAAHAMDWSPSKMLRIETGMVGISVTDLRALLTYYNIEDKRQIEKLIDLVRATKKKGSAL